MNSGCSLVNILLGVRQFFLLPKMPCRHTNVLVGGVVAAELLNNSKDSTLKDFEPVNLIGNIVSEGTRRAVNILKMILTKKRCALPTNVLNRIDEVGAI